MDVENYKCVVVGDGAVGKTCMLVCYTENKFPEEYAPTIFDTYTANLIVDERRVNLSLWDTAGQEDFEKLRPLSYSETNVFVICFSISLRDSYENVKSKWIPEIDIHESDTPFIVVGTKMDIREENKNPEKDDLYVTKKEGLELVKQTRAHSYVECSALEQKNLNLVFEEACRAIFADLKAKELAELEDEDEHGKRRSAKRGKRGSNGEDEVSDSVCGCVLV